MSTVVIAMIVKPFVALILFGLICLPARIIVQKMRDGKLKRFLLFRISDSPGGGKPRQ
jgi:hypothetical protein